MRRRLVNFAVYLFAIADQTTSGMFTNAWQKSKKLLGFKAGLPYLELHLTDHCNLNCRGCAHFCPIAEKWFANPVTYARDMLQLRKLFSTIQVIRLMGGDPLLHPKLEFFLPFTRSCFPKADIRLVTNGILLFEMPSSFWDACRTNSITIDVTVYPPLRSQESFFVELANSKRVKIQLLRPEKFFAVYNKNGNSEIGTSFRNCVMKTPNLREGKLYHCPFNAYSHNFNRQYGTRIPIPMPVNIYAPKLSGWDVIELLSKAPSTCRYCTLGWDIIPTFPWSKSKRIMTEWEATINKSSKDWLANPLTHKKTRVNSVKKATSNPRTEGKA